MGITKPVVTSGRRTFLRRREKDVKQRSFVSARQQVHAARSKAKASGRSPTTRNGSKTCIVCEIGRCELGSVVEAETKDASEKSCMYMNTVGLCNDEERNAINEVDDGGKEEFRSKTILPDGRCLDHECRGDSPDAVSQDDEQALHQQLSNNGIQSGPSPGAYSRAPGRTSVLLPSVNMSSYLHSAPRISVPSDHPIPVINEMGEEGGDEESVAVATKVDDAEPVVYANLVKRDDQKSKYMKKGAAMCGIAVSLAVGLGVGLSLRPAPTSNTSSSNYTGWDHPPQRYFPWKDCSLADTKEGTDLSPDSTPSSKRFSDFEKLLIAANVSSPEDLSEKCSPQNQALTWIADDDDLALPAEAPSLEAVVQRFSLAVTFFATNGPSWISSYRWLSDVHECEWGGVTCSEGLAVTRILFRRENNVGGYLPKEISALKDLFLLVGTENSIGGTIPSEIASLENLEELVLGKNRFSGTLPAWLFSMKKLWKLDLVDSNISGTFPEISPPSSNLRILVLPNNTLEGKIPDSLRKLQNLEVLILGENKFTGTLVDAFSDLCDLNCVELGGNEFNGTIPEGLMKMSSLTRLSLRNNNNLSGAVPDEVCRIVRRNRLLFCDMDSVECPCCADCSDMEGPLCEPKDPPREG